VSTVATIAAAERRRRSRLKRIVVSERNYLALKELGRAGDSFNDVVSKLLRIERSYQEMKKQQQVQQEQETNDNSNNSNNGLLFSLSPAEILNEQNSRLQLDKLIRSLQNKRSSRNDQTTKQ
jgi:hypothetical protein